MGRRQRPFFLGFLNGFAFTLGRRRHWVRARPVEDAVSQANTSVGRIDDQKRLARANALCIGCGVFAGYASADKTCLAAVVQRIDHMGGLIPQAAPLQIFHRVERALFRE